MCRRAVSPRREKPTRLTASRSSEQSGQPTTMSGGVGQGVFQADPLQFSNDPLENSERTSVRAHHGPTLATSRCRSRVTGNTGAAITGPGRQLSNNPLDKSVPRVGPRPPGVRRKVVVSLSTPRRNIRKQAERRPPEACHQFVNDPLAN